MKSEKRMNRLRIAMGALLVGALAALIGCGGESGGRTRIQGAGATFPNPLYQKWFSEYNKTRPDARFDYQSIGSGGGIRQVISRTVDFGGSDAPMTDEDLQSAPGPILHIPTVLGADVITYNLPNFTGELKLTPEAVAGIFLGTITKWNDPAIAASNPEFVLPDASIQVVHRSDGSGTTYVFTDWLSKVSPEWKQRVGAGTSVRWPVGQGAKGNEGVTGQIKSTPNTIGYVELVYAEQNKLPYAAIRNAAGQFVKPSLASVTAAAAATAEQMPEDLRVSITNPPGTDAYPIAAFTYLLVYQQQPDRAKGKALVDFLNWAITDGQRFASELLYAPLPAEVVARAQSKIKTITCEGQALAAVE